MSYSSQEERIRVMREKKRKLARQQRKNNVEPRHYTRRDEAFASRLSAGTRLLGENDVG